MATFILFVMFSFIGIAAAVEVRYSNEEELYFNLGYIQPKPIPVPMPCCLVYDATKQRENEEWLARVDSEVEAAEMIRGAINELELRANPKKVHLAHAHIVVEASQYMDSMEAYLSCHEKVNQLRQIAWAN